jgi:plastocyanin
MKTETTGSALIWTAVVLAVVIAASLWVRGRTPAQQAAGGVAATVDMTQGLTFVPSAVEINVGDSVEWRNVSSLEHTVTADPGKATQRRHVALPPGAQPFDSGNLQPGEKFRHLFTVPGTYRYFCIPHEAAGMVGEITVRPQSVGRVPRSAP